MSGTHRDDRGRFVARHSDADVLAAVAKYAPAGTTEIAEELGIERPSADYRLRQLEAEGAVRKKKIGSSLAWSLANGGE
ncbi:helix-turn-helix domain-containing protein [Halomarina pelagica]|uniref:helix-turn-helix domain-containing protein n=1 Tax=Halomarina pelagica TaxID=2961599 RepID=UPI0020C40F74|nr:helix-turn-helix domain-containing protein [Halomarina sp. BND7]